MTNPSSESDVSVRASSATPGEEAVVSAPASPYGSVTTPGSARGRRNVSLFRYAPLLIVLLVVIADAGQRTDPDLWGHVRFGQLMLEHHAVVRTDPYSYSALGQPWHDHEWLTEVVMAFAYNHLGVIGLKVWKFACVSATVLFLVVGLAETGASAPVQFNTLLVAAVALMPWMEFRPQVFTFALFAGLLAILARHNFRGSAPLWLAIPIMALWANLHGGYLIGIATLGAYAAVVGAQDVFAGRGLGRGFKLGLLAAAGTLATLLSPYGIENWLVVLNALRVHADLNVILDWVPLTQAMSIQWHAGHPGIIFYLCGLGLMAAFAVSFLLRPKGDDLPFVAIAAMMSVGAFTAARNLPLAIIACCLPVVRHVPLLFDRRRAPAESDPVAARSGLNPWVVIGLVAVLIVARGIFSTRIQTEKAYPLGAVNFMKANSLRGNVLVDFNWAEYFIWHVPESKVFFDGRYDSLYSLKIIDQYLAFYFDTKNASGMLGAYPHEFVLIPPSSGAYSVMSNATGWRLIYHDQDSALFARTGSRAARLPGVPVAGNNPQLQYFP